jgi:Holliday junction resolvase-like predicted endonuclease
MTNTAEYHDDGTRVRNLKESASRKGDFAEFYAVTWLWDNGYEVFVNAGCNGPIDMIAFKDGETIFIDVKTQRFDGRRKVKTISNARTKEQENLGVVLLAFNPDTRKLKWVEHTK